MAGVLHLEGHDQSCKQEVFLNQERLRDHSGQQLCRPIVPRSERHPKDYLFIHTHQWNTGNSQRCCDRYERIFISYFSFPPSACSPPSSYFSLTTLVDAIGVVTETGPVTSITSKQGKELRKRNITIADTSTRAVELTLWGQAADNPGWTEGTHPIIAIKSAKVSDFNSKFVCVSVESLEAFMTFYYKQIKHWLLWVLPWST